ncbi:MAG: chemotaxis protein CheD [Paracoccus denitrificans]|uniref:Probable chemoreceptor glutamine deamidase CheD n=1 Tax=Paracoccus denitrificans TaxID=266 RepID=A0A533I7Y4_PARDE|nr:MAG: chemotaxis protein CheD [Paracoccus denitrificans]
MTIKRRHIIQGQYETAQGDADCCMTTVLGSCISVCLHDPVSGAGGMNHFLLAQGRSGATHSASYGVNAMELLINGLLKLGANRCRLRAHVFGGARMVAGLGNVGQRNAEFAISFLRAEGMRVMTCSVGGTQARRINFWPATGRATEELIQQNIVETAPVAAPSGDVELF